MQARPTPGERALLDEPLTPARRGQSSLSWVKGTSLRRRPMAW